MKIEVQHEQQDKEELMKLFNYINPWKMPSRINRTRYFLASTTLVILMLVVCFSLYVAIYEKPIISISFVIGILAMVMCIAAISTAIIKLQMKRLHDFNTSGWWVLVFWLCGFSGLSFVLWFIPGSEGRNNFGVQPKKLTMLERVFLYASGVLFIMIFIAAILFV